MTAQASRAAAPAASTRGGADRRSQPRGARAAAEHVAERDATTVGTGRWALRLPPGDQLVFIAGVGLMAAIGLIEWPVALVVVVGHELAHSHHGKILREFGDVLEEA